MADEAPVQSKKTPFTLALIAGGCAGTSVDVSLHPVDTIRCRLQSPDGFWKAGGFRGVYQGISSNALASAPSAALFFSTYETMKYVFKKLSGDQESSVHHALASSCGEVAACTIRTPQLVITQRLMVGQFSGLRQALLKTYEAGGIRGFYAGYTSLVIREVPFALIQFPIYERLKKLWSAWQGAPASPLVGAACGSMAGAIAGACTTPLDVAKTRIMLEKPTEDKPAKYTSPGQTLRTIAAEEGVLALFRGIGPRVMWITGGGFIFFGAYESATKLLWSSGLW